MLFLCKFVQYIRNIVENPLAMLPSGRHVHMMGGWGRGVEDFILINETLVQGISHTYLLIKSGYVELFVVPQLCVSLFSKTVSVVVVFQLNVNTFLNLGGRRGVRR